MDKLTTENFGQLDILRNTPYLIKFTSKTCGPCNAMKPVFDALQSANPKFKFLEVDTGESPELAAHFNIKGVPTTHFCENREIIYSFSGTTPLRDLQYVIDNINDPYLREHGEFPPTQQKKDNSFIYIVAVAIVIVLSLFLLAASS